MHGQKSSFSPVNEQGVVALVCKRAEGRGWSIISVGAAFPDAVMEYNGQEYRVEFEYLSSNFIAHGHDPRDCDLVICWQNDTPEMELPVIEVGALSWDFEPVSDSAKAAMYWRVRALRAERERTKLRNELVAARATLPAWAGVLSLDRFRQAVAGARAVWGVARLSPGPMADRTAPPPTKVQPAFEERVAWASAHIQSRGRISAEAIRGEFRVGTNAARAIRDAAVGRVGVSR